MVTYAVAFVFVIFDFLWGALEYWRQGHRRIALASATAARIAGLVLVAAIYVLRYGDNPWAWIGLPMACRYRLHGC